MFVNCSFHFASPAFSQFRCLPDLQLLIFAISAEMGAGAAHPVVGIREKWREPDLLMNLKKRASAKYSKTGHACFPAFSHLSAS